MSDHDDIFSKILDQQWTQRDQIAFTFMQGLLDPFPVRPGEDEPMRYKPEYAAKRAVEYADALLLALRQKHA
jgi:hypothetical protein